MIKRSRLLLALLIALMTPALSAQTEPTAQPAGATKSHYEGAPWVGFVADRQNEEELEIAAVLKQSPAEKAKLKVGDVIERVDDQAIANVRDLKRVLRGKSAGDTLAITARRGTKREAVTLKLEAMPTQSELARAQLLGAEAPDFEVQLLGEDPPRTIKAEELRGAITVIDFWASWCEPCGPFRDQLSELHELHGDRINLLAVSNEPEEVIKAYVRKHQLAYDVARDRDERMHDAYFVRALPLALVLDEEGRVRKVITGEQDVALIAKSVASLLEASEPKKEVKPTP